MGFDNYAARQLSFMLCPFKNWGFIRSCWIWSYRANEKAKQKNMVDYLLHVYRKGSRPFQTLSVLSDHKALDIMKNLYVEGSVFWERFKQPVEYLQFRRQVETKVRMDFVGKGGKPKEKYPIYLILGRPKWMDVSADQKTIETTEIIEIPLSTINPDEVSFTYPDSMVSAIMIAEKNPEYYEPDYHGKVFTLNEITEIVKERGLPGEGWQTRMPKQYAHYIEAQVWNHEVLENYLNKKGIQSQ